jgi:hypothetical protein
MGVRPHHIATRQDGLLRWEPKIGHSRRNGGDVLCQVLVPDNANDLKLMRAVQDGSLTVPENCVNGVLELSKHESRAEMSWCDCLCWVELASDTDLQLNLNWMVLWRRRASDDLWGCYYRWSSLCPLCSC